MSFSASESFFLDANHGGKNADALLSLLHFASKLVPRIQPGHSRRGWHLPGDFEELEGVTMEAAHRGEVGGECLRSVLPQAAR